MKNEIDPAFENQLPANVPSAPSTPGHLPTRQATQMPSPGVLVPPLLSPKGEELAKKSGQFEDWKSTPIR
jgi:hypothetical protein